MMDNSLLKHLLNQSDEHGDDPIIATYIMPIPPSVQMNLSIDVATIVGGILYPFSASFLIPVSLPETHDFSFCASLAPPPQGSQKGADTIVWT